MDRFVQSLFRRDDGRIPSRPAIAGNCRGSYVDSCSFLNFFSPSGQCFHECSVFALFSKARFSGFRSFEPRPGLRTSKDRHFFGISKTGFSGRTVRGAGKSRPFSGRLPAARVAGSRKILPLQVLPATTVCRFGKSEKKQENHGDKGFEPEDKIG